MRRCVCDLEASRMRRPRSALGRSATREESTSRSVLLELLTLLLFTLNFILLLPLYKYSFKLVRGTVL